MANSLTITLTEFRTIGSPEVLCGYVACDQFSDASCRVAKTWQDFKAQYPTLESLINCVLGEDVFSSLAVDYTVDGLSIEVAESDDEDTSLSYIAVEGAEHVYGSQTVPTSPAASAQNEILREFLKEAFEYTVGDLDYDNFELLKERAAPHMR